MLMSDPAVETLVVSDLNERMQRVVDKLILYGQNDVSLPVARRQVMELIRSQFNNGLTV